MLLYKNSILISPHDFPGVGPIARYSQVGQIVFLETNGASEKGEIISSNKHYFVVSADDPVSPEVAGLLSEAEFNSNAAVKNYSPINWKRPKNPNVLAPVVGSAMSFFIMIPILLIVHAKISVPLALLFLATWFFVRRKQRLARQRQPS